MGGGEVQTRTPHNDVGEQTHNRNITKKPPMNCKHNPVAPGNSFSAPIGAVSAQVCNAAKSSGDCLVALTTRATRGAGASGSPSSMSPNFCNICGTKSRPSLCSTMLGPSRIPGFDFFLVLDKWSNGCNVDLPRSA